MNMRLGFAVCAVVSLTIGCDTKADSAKGNSSANATGCPAGSTEGTGQGFCIRLPKGFKLEKVDGDTTSFVNDKYDRIRIERDKAYTFKNTPDDFKSMAAGKTPTASGPLLGGKGGWALLDDGKVALGSVRVNHPKGGMLTWSLTSDSKSGKVQSQLETAKTITLL